MMDTGNYKQMVQNRTELADIYVQDPGLAWWSI